MSFFFFCFFFFFFCFLSSAREPCRYCEGILVQSMRLINEKSYLLSGKILR